MFILKGSEVIIEPKMLFIPEFSEIWKRDKSTKKSFAKKEFAYIYFMADYQSEYNSYGLEKEQYIRTDIIGDKKYKPDKVVLAAIGKYEKMQETYSMRYLRAARKTIDSLIKYYEDLQYKPSDDAQGYDPTIVIKAMKEIEIIVEKIEKWERKVQTEEDHMEIRGGGMIGVFEDEKDAPWLNGKINRTSAGTETL